MSKKLEIRNDNSSINIRTSRERAIRAEGIAKRATEKINKSMNDFKSKLREEIERC